MVEGDAATPASPQRALGNLLALYLLGVVSGGLYLLLWIARLARTLGAGDADRRRPVVWAVGAIAPPVALCVVHELAERTDAGGAAPGGLRWPAVLYALIETSLFALDAPFVLGALLRPLPALWIQQAWLRERVAFAPAAPERAPSRAAAIALTTVGALLLAPTVWFSDLPKLARWSATALAPDAIVTAPSDDFTLRVPGDGWRRADPADLGDGLATIALLGPDESEVFVFLHEGDRDLDTVVDRRRMLLQDLATLDSIEEDRRFAEGAALRPRSLAIYRGREGLLERCFVVVTSADDAHAIEVVATGPARDGMENRLLDLARSFAWAPTAERKP